MPLPLLWMERMETFTLAPKCLFSPGTLLPAHFSLSAAFTHRSARFLNPPLSSPRHSSPVLSSSLISSALLLPHLLSSPLLFSILSLLLSPTLSSPFLFSLFSLPDFTALRLPRHQPLAPINHTLPPTLCLPRSLRSLFLITSSHFLPLSLFSLSHVLSLILH